MHAILCTLMSVRWSHGQSFCPNFHAPIGAIVSIFVSSVSVQKFAFQFILLEANLGHCVISL